MAKRHISITNGRVLEAFDNAAKSNKGSRLIEDAVLYYLDSLEHEYITKDQVSAMILNALNQIQITNPNYSSEQLGADITSILNL